MRFLRLDFRDDLNSIDLHPLVTVVKSLEPEHRRQLLRAVRRLADGTTAGLRGLVEHQGGLVELDAPSGVRLDAAPTSADVLVYIGGGRDDAGLVALQAEIDQWERHAEVDAVAVEEVRANLDLAARSVAAELAHRADGGTRSSSQGARLRLDTVRHAYEVVGSVRRSVSENDPALLELIERWDDYARRLGAGRDHLEQLSRQAKSADGVVARSLQELERAQKEAEPVVLTREDEARLELLADPSADPSRKGRRRHGLSDEEQAEMNSLLAKVGVESWTAYSVLRLSPAVPPEKQAQLERAQAALQAAQAEAAQARAALDGDATAAQLRQTLEQLKTDARQFVGVLVPADIGAALREQVETVDNPDWLRAVNDLRDTLASNDLRPPGGLDPDDTMEWTEAWLRLGEADPEAVGGRRADDAGPGAGRSIEEESDTARAALVRHNRALARIDEVERRAARSAERLAELRHRHEAWSDQPVMTTAAEVLARVEPVVERVVADTGGSLPVVVIGSMAELPPAEAVQAMAELERLSRRVQLLVVTERVEMAQWAVDVGLERAGLCSGVRALI